ncbi:DUF2164 family protein [Candidatus Saccharibacteria bacterium]|nr:DUF2164 family protein [Candidatus Saccharibacteria bacterium]
MIRKWDITNEQEKKQCLEEILTRLDEQGDAPFGVLAAEEILDIVSQHVGPQVYNMAIEDAKNALRTKLADLEIDLDMLGTSS